MRSFHVSRESANDFCQTLNLDESVLKVIPRPTVHH